ncbi:TonB-dependent receptor [Halovibrio variabilis]|uniref:TonB-dependent receptor n=1 Tax=Halovibrio variabilis TaxID=31910 RepID=UPI001FE964F8|nr:TonB-dependent receptor [Halovibrio variabilis]
MKIRKLVEDLIDATFQTQIGEVRSRGFELEVKTEIGLNANLVTAYAYTDARNQQKQPGDA